MHFMFGGEVLTSRRRPFGWMSDHRRHVGGGEGGSVLHLFTDLSHDATAFLHCVSLNHPVNNTNNQ